MEEKVEQVKQESILLERIRRIRDSQDVPELITKISAYAENLGVSKIKFRLKQAESALTKFEERGFTKSEEVGDLCGIMLITDDEEQIYEIEEFLQRIFSESKIEIDDYVQKPKSGYRSLHMNMIIANIEDLEGDVLPLEIQIKTRAMAIAQDVVHDSIYKNQKMPKNIRNQLSSIAFPIIENKYKVDRLREQGKETEANELQAGINRIIEANSKLFYENYPIEKLWRNYGKTVFKHHNEEHIEREVFLKGYTPEETAKRNMQFEDTIDAVYDYFKEEGKREDIGNSIRYATRKMKTLDYQDFSSLLKQIHASLDREEAEEEKARLLHEYSDVEMTEAEKFLSEIDTERIVPGSIEDFEAIHQGVPKGMFAKVQERLKDLRKLRKRGDHFIGK